MKNIFVFMVCIFFSGNLYAEQNDVSSLNADWGDASNSLCKEHAIGDFNWDFCLHDVIGCKEKKLQSPIHPDDEYSNYMWIATKVTKGGAYFCPMRIDASNKNKGNSTWTTYSYMSGTNEFCVWLCKDGFGGPDCSDTDGDYVCDTTNLKWNASDAYMNKNTDKREAKGLTTNSEDSVAMFSRANYDKCGLNVKEEHDRILAVVGWLKDASGKKFEWKDNSSTSGSSEYTRGAIVRQMMVRARHSGYKDMVSWPNIYPATNSDEILLCKTGYKPDPVSKKCVEINATRCAEQNLCDKYKTGFDETIHTMKLEGKCYEYRCKEEGKAFASTTDRSCVDCPITLRSGPNSADGTCLKCDQDKIYTGSVCKEATRYSKTDLMYGRGKTRTDVPSLKSQCWTILDTDAYELCVKGSDK